MRFHSFTRPLLVLVLAGLATGCDDVPFLRGYGGYGTEEAAMTQILEANEVFADELARARGDLNLLQQASGSELRLQPLVGQFQELVMVHDYVLRQHVAMAEEMLEDESYDNWLHGYRRVSTALQAIVAEQDLLRARYGDALTRIRSVVDTTAAVPGGVVPEARYQAVPPYYARATSPTQRTTMAAALGRFGGSLGDPLPPGATPPQIDAAPRAAPGVAGQ